MELAKDVCQHKLREVRALLHMRRREALQERVQELNEADDLVVDLRTRLHTAQCLLHSL